MKVKDLIEGQVVVTAELDDSLQHVADLMQEHHVSGVPIVDEWGGLAGLVAASDIVRLASPKSHHAVELPVDPSWSPAQHTVEHDPGWRLVKARDVMVSDLCTVAEDDEVHRAARSMTKRGVHRAVVLAQDRNVCGILSTLDLAQLVAEEPADD